MREIISR